MAPPAEIVDGRKTFIPLGEKQPRSVSPALSKSRVAPGLTFHDVISTSPDLLSWIPRPIHALILLADAPIFHAVRSPGKPTIPEYKGSGPAEPVVWMRQTIGHACGLMALLHCLFNLDDRQYVTRGSELDQLLETAIGLAPSERADLLYQSQFLEKAHMEAASQGSSAPPSPQDENHHHFVGFVQKGKDVWELNGGLNGPLHRGELNHGDLLSERGLALTVQDFLDAAAQGGHGEMSIVAIAGTDAQPI
ncbi:hypothetical protein N7468_000092 [Penicillium chermesinum]|uniref:Ubiquitin carboxyl-terminal hydrolase n=1 Tax=Penicillium chermesinum TaxID=63820 RepID=A0A9W9PJL2_9EURO|nr:uncharacterized protein N7468_000092 [Penicillium chermesinum]KAJ5248641.1 hypothetical protein N7468_000092 [Penicillium chermesinum]